jgi:hypothetical protein
MKKTAAKGGRAERRLVVVIVTETWIRDGQRLKDTNQLT